MKTKGYKKTKESLNSRLSKRKKAKKLSRNMNAKALNGQFRFFFVCLI